MVLIILSIITYEGINVLLGELNKEQLILGLINGWLFKSDLNEKIREASSLQTQSNGHYITSF